MNKLGVIVLVLLAILTASYVGFGIWTETKHDKSAIEYIQDKLDEKDEIVVEDETGEVEATASINF